MFLLIIADRVKMPLLTATQKRDADRAHIHPKRYEDEKTVTAIMNRVCSIHNKVYSHVIDLRLTARHPCCCLTGHAGDKKNFTQNKRATPNLEIMRKIQDL